MVNVKESILHTLEKCNKSSRRKNYVAVYIPGCGERSSLFAFDNEAVSVSEGDVVVCGVALSLRMACGASLVPRLSLFRMHNFI